MPAARSRDQRSREQTPELRQVHPHRHHVVDGAGGVRPLDVLHGARGCAPSLPAQRLSDQLAHGRVRRRRRARSSCRSASSPTAWKRVSILALGLIPWAFGMAGQGIATSFAMLFVFRMFLGALEPTGGQRSPAVNSLLADYYPVPDRQIVFGRLVIATILGYAAGPDPRRPHRGTGGVGRRPSSSGAQWKSPTSSS